ncbi:MAG: enolase C-terminal domain-like protein [Planctomycetota bacterium]|jgi:L-alanine-DL-glutamate epimerase-like enolase superfamily enzyme|nr:enolase C-terminal domain-like protein [Planctomycetota bacterium]
MKISGIRFLEVKGTMKTDGPMGEERLVRPVDIYPEFRAQASYGLPPDAEDGTYPMQALYLFIDTDSDVSGIWGPISGDSARTIGRSLKAVLMDEDPRAVERIWDKMYRYSVHGRKGETMMAISDVDLALWDIKGKLAGAPVYELLGGPTRESIPAYASALGYSIEPERAYARAKAFVEEGYRATKWFFRCDPTEGPEGMARNLDLIRTIREAVGPDVKIMFDAWMSWDVPYTIRMAEQAAEHRPYWFEEPVLPDKIDQYAEIRRAVSSAFIAGGEHEYTRWGIYALLKAGAVDILQPDVTWAGGLTEMTKICALASVYDIPVIPHHGGIAATQLIASQTIITCPMQEYLIQHGARGQFFHKDPVTPKGGNILLPNRPGIGIELDGEKIEARRELSEV